LIGHKQANRRGGLTIAAAAATASCCHWRQKQWP